MARKKGNWFETDFRFSRRRLPHSEQRGAIYFITWSTTPGFALPAAARDVVLKTCRHFDGSRYRLWALVVMPTHVHAVLEPLRTEPACESDLDTATRSLSSILHSLKSYSAHRVNAALHRRGRVWLPERYDRILRDENELTEKLEYIVNNPVEVKLVTHPAQYRWLFVRDRQWLE